MSTDTTLPAAPLPDGTPQGAVIVPGSGAITPPAFIPSVDIPAPTVPAQVKRLRPKKPVIKFPLREPLAVRAGDKCALLDIFTALYLHYYGNGYNVRDALRGALQDCGILRPGKRKLPTKKKVNPNTQSKTLNTR